MRRSLLLGILIAAAADLLAAGRIIIVNVDPPGIGFNDPTPVAPVGGNEGLTRGQQRLNVYEKAAERWRNTVDTKVDVRIRSSFAPLPCGDTVVLGQTQILSWSANFQGAPRRDLWYPAALANQFAGFDLRPNDDDMSIQFNSAVDNPDCVGDRSWYYGFDGKEGTDDALYSVVLHEIAHGLGFAGRTLDDFGNMPSVFDIHTFDVSAGRRWDQMTAQERAVSMTNTGNLVWDGPNVTRAAASVLEPITYLTVTEPAPVAKNYEVGTAAFGPAASRAALTGRAVLAADAANESGPTTTDGCTAFTNADAIAGNIAIIDRGTCTFVQKVRNAQAAGAIGVIVVDNRRTSCLPPALGGSDPEVTIPAISVTQDDGAALKAQLSSENGVRGMLRVDPSRLAGTVQQGFVRLYAPCNFEGGSSVFHFDTSASPNLLMEPFINADLIDNVDLTLQQLMDIGWTQPARTGRRFLRR